jgi:DNA-binding transcriptional LysR family regulator
LSIELSHLRCFVVVAQELHFGRAAERLVYTTSHVSRQVRSLEKELGVQLFDRTTRRVSLTPAGGALLDKSLALIGLADEISDVDSWRPVEGEMVRIAFSPTTGAIAGALVSRLVATAPELTVQLEPHATSAEVTAAVASRRASIGLAQWVGPGVRSEVVAEIAEMAAVPADHRLAASEQITVHDLDGEPLLVPRRASNPKMYDEMVAEYEMLGVAPRFVGRNLTSTEQIIDLVAAGQGIGLLPVTSAAVASERGVACVDVSPTGRPRNAVFLIWNPEAPGAQLESLRALARQRPLTD